MQSVVKRAAQKRRMDLALCMGMHARLGEVSPLLLLSKDILDTIRRMANLTAAAY